MRNIQAIETNFLILEEEEENEIYQQEPLNDSGLLDDQIQRRIDREIVKKEFYSERIAKFREWTDIVLMNVEGIMKTIGREDDLGEQNEMHLATEGILSGSDRAALNAEDVTLTGRSRGEKKRHSDILGYQREPQNAFQVRKS